MQLNQKLYRKDYTGEDVNVIGIYIDNQWQYQKEFVTNPFTNLPFSNHAVVIGNGVSRKDFDLRLFLDHRDVAAWGEVGAWKPAINPKKFNTYGCNAIYRNYRPDFVIAVGEDMIQEMANSNYCDDNPVYSNAWALPLYPGKFNYIPQDPGYNAGAIAAYLAAFDGHKKVFMLGFDGIDSIGDNYNIYAGTPGYPGNHVIISENFWVNSLNEIMQLYSDVEFVRVTPTANFRTPEPWKYLSNFRTVDFRQFVVEADI